MKNCLPSERLLLCPLSPNYFEQYLDKFSETVRNFLGVRDTETEYDYLKVHYRQLQQNQTLFFCLFLQDSEELIGAIEIRKPHYRSQLYYWLNEDYWSKGFLQESLKKAVEYYFEIHKDQTQVHALVDCSNVRSYTTLEKCGFTMSLIRKGPREDQKEMVFRR